MKRTTRALFALVFAGACLQPFFAAEPVVTIDCASLRLPRMVDVGAVTGIDNVGTAYAEREKLMHQAARLCRNPAVAIVRFVPDSTVTVQPIDGVAAR
ncbi:MAG TPA: hypothetical protein VHQ21_01135 [Rhodanobacteraceae bacterium]|jgi:hypothetical protein|nr:hypothetical protein [Rhodanobacteraceae bacterium]